MLGYKIYLTKSYEVAILLQDAWRGKLGKENLESVSAGKVSDDDRIPAMYHGCGYYYCRLEYKDLKQPVYEIVFA